MFNLFASHYGVFTLTCLHARFIPSIKHIKSVCGSQYTYSCDNKTKMKMETKVSIFLVIQLENEEMLIDGMIGTEVPSQLTETCTG